MKGRFWLGGRHYIMNEVYAGIDIGSSKVCTILGELGRNNELQILGVGMSGCNGLKKGIVIDVDATAEAIRSSVRQAERMSNMEIESAYINIAGGHVKLIKNNGVIAVSRGNREIGTDDIERVLRAAKVVSIPVDREVIGIIPIQFTVDGYEHIKDPVGMVGTRLEAEASIITAPTSTVQNLIKSVERAGIEVSGLVIDSLSLAELLLTRDEKEMGIAVVDVGAEVTDISVFINNTLVYTKLIPIGGFHITNDISLGLKIPTSEAEILKRQYGYASVSMVESKDDIIINNTDTNKNSNLNIGSNAAASSKWNRTITSSELVDIIEARVNEIIYLINRELIISGYKERIPGGLVITGGGISYIKGITHYASSMINLPVRIGSPSYLGVSTPVYSTGTGIVKYILSSKKKSVSREYEEDYEDSSISKSEKQNSEKFIDKLKNFFSDFF